MLPFDIDLVLPPESRGPGRFLNPVLPPVVRDFDPDMETLSFTLPAEDADAAIYLRDLVDTDGVRVEVGGRTLVVLMGVSADEIGPNALQFEFEE